MARRSVCIGLISGLLRPQALAALRGSDYLIHAGDIGDPAILDRLAELAPLTAIRGNNDRDPAYAEIPEVNSLKLGDVRIHIVHDLAAFDPATAGHVDVVISGHSHKPLRFTRDGVLCINPGSAGPRRFRLPVSVGRLRIDGDELHAEVIELKI